MNLKNKMVLPKKILIINRYPLLALILSLILYNWVLSTTDHSKDYFVWMILLASGGKMVTIIWISLSKIKEYLREFSSLQSVFLSFFVLIFVTIASFALDYHCLQGVQPFSISGIQIEQSSYLQQLFDFFYFSFITFSTIGYGDIVPISIYAKLLVMAETFMSFFIVVFAFSNISKMHLKN
ncbi:MAG: hypothetical protein CL840_18770 [Crocinitomicaceae bacterium]|nr:hypothetical protein [Crocinitomicaceae bacterium]|tara:strand:+ start:12855 stop:13397 length:543 start_codon:yes stop_codon:yes gene_type:complete